jgi:exonuclease, DNA polymerase III, epsilon subunit family
MMQFFLIALALAFVVKYPIILIIIVPVILYMIWNAWDDKRHGTVQDAYDELGLRYIEEAHRVGIEKKSKIVSVFTNKWFDKAADTFTVIDIETTGLSKITDHIVEIAAIRYNGGLEWEKMVSLVKPPVEIPQVTIDIHHITNRMVKDAPTIEDVLPAFLEFIGDDLVVGHNVNFDIGFIELAARRLGYDPVWNYVDTISVAKKIIPGLPNYKQATVINALGIRQDIAHRAEDDCRACAEILILALQKIANGEMEG